MAAHNAHDSKAAVAEAMSLADLVLWNEAVPVDSPRWTLERGGKGVITGWRTDTGLRHLGSWWHQAHGGRAGVTPARGSLVTRLELPGGSGLAVVNGHRINGTGWPGNRRRSFRDWRRRRWLDHDALDRRLIADLLRRGYTVLLGADVNRTDMPPPHPDAIPLRNGGITQLWLIPGRNGPALQVGRTDSIGGLARGSSHRLQRASLVLS